MRRGRHAGPQRACNDYLFDLTWNAHVGRADAWQVRMEEFDLMFSPTNEQTALKPATKLVTRSVKEIMKKVCIFGQGYIDSLPTALMFATHGLKVLNESHR